MAHRNPALTRLTALPEVAAVAAAFAAAGSPVALVGGCVRDALMTGADFDPQEADLDFATPLDPERITRIVDPLGPIWDAGARFGTIGVSLDTGNGPVQVEITQFRTERYDPGSRKPHVVPAATLEEDLARRDATINSMALAHTGGAWTLVDPFDGTGDLRRRVLRCPGDPGTTLAEDPLRIVRLVRFATRLGFTIDPTVAVESRRHAERLEIVAVERVARELRKILAAGPAAFANALDVAHDLGVASTLTGGACDLDGLQDALRAVSVPHGVEPSTVALCQLALHDNSTRPLKALKLSNDEVRPAARCLTAAHDLAEVDSVRAARRFLRRHGRETATTAIATSRTARHVEHATTLVAAALSADPELPDRPLPVTGRDATALGLSGPAVGAALARVEAAFCEHGSLDRDAALAILAR